MIYYMISMCPHSFIKIGRAVDPWERRRDLNCSSPYEVKLLRVERSDNDVRYEKVLHARFAHLKHRGEWFKPGPDLMEHIASLDADVEKYKQYAKRKRPKKLTAFQEQKLLDSGKKKIRHFMGESEAVKVSKRAYEKMGDLIEEM